MRPLYEKQNADVLELAEAATEQRNPRSENLDKLTTAEFVDLFVDEETHVSEALTCRAQLARARD